MAEYTNGTCEIFGKSGEHVAFEDDESYAFERCADYAKVPSNYDGKHGPNCRKRIVGDWRGYPIVRVTFPDGSESHYGIGEKAASRSR